jgi:bacteriophage N4 adsorption protein B
MWFDHWVVRCLVPLALWILLSGLDDLFITVVYAATRRRPFPWPAGADLERTPERRIAILVPLWHEHRVIGRMLEHNLSVIRYSNYDIFVGAYPNDELTVRVVSEIAAQNPRVHLAVCPHDGPTSKGDCLNWIYRRLEDFEEQEAVRFEVVMTHDAEDLIHPESLRIINWFSRGYDMVQIPVLPLRTPAREWTHGLYCDEFAEYQLKDIRVRQVLGGFLPSNGVGTGFGREALERLALTRGGRIFDPDCLTEDYENGFRLHAMGGRQIFVPVRIEPGGPIATREYFPRNFRAAMRQRSRWVTGIALQGWQNHGWRAPWRQIYWLWRDRKGLAGNLLSPVSNFLYLYLVASYAARDPAARTGLHLPVWLLRLCTTTMILSALQTGLRMGFCARLYGWRMAALAPLRIFWGNTVNGVATMAALRQFIGARLRNRTPAWRKTDHVYPVHRTAHLGRPRLGEVLIGLRRLSKEEIEAAVRELPSGVRLGEYLVRHARLSEDHLYEALSSHAGIPLGLPPRRELNRAAARTLPADAMRRWHVLPYRIALGQLHVVVTDVPSDEMSRNIARLCDLEIRFRLVRPRDFDKLAAELLAPVR